MFKQRHVLFLGLALLFLGGLALAGPLPSYDYVGINKAIKVSSSGYPNTIDIKTSSGSSTTVTGGGFTAQMSKNGSTPYTATTTVWCVDSQLGFLSNTALQANVTSLTNAGAFSSQVRYGGLSGNTGGAYNNSTVANRAKFVYDVGLTGAADNALNRYKMAAYLVAQYNGFPAGPADTLPLGGADNDKNDALQRAVWKIMYNNSGSNKWSFSGLDIAAGAPGGMNWVQTALSFIQNPNNQSFFSKWAVVSWDVTDSGDLNSRDTPDMQTFLVQVVPEPSFYGLLALGLGGLFLAARGRKIIQVNPAE
jgi:hypothetical protein